MAEESGPSRAVPGGDGVRLVLVRHAKAVRKDPRIDDFDRALGKRGRREAPRTGRWLAESGYATDLGLVLCSPSRRTRETWELAAFELDDPPPADHDPRLYKTPPAELVSVLRERGRGLRAVALVGHNPGIHELAAGLCGSGPPDLLEQVRDGFPTSGVVVIELPGGWEGLAPGSGRVSARWSPAAPEGPGRGEEGAER